MSDDNDNSDLIGETPEQKVIREAHEEREAALALLSPHQATAEKIDAFLRQYIIDSDKVRAYKKIWPGCTHTTANTNSTRLLGRPNVRERYRQLFAEAHGEYQLTAKRVLDELSAMAFYDPDDYYTHDETGKRVAVDLRTLSPVQRAAIVEIQTKTDKEGNTYTTLKLADRAKNLERLGRHLKLFTDVLEVGETDELAARIKARRQAMKREKEHDDLI